MDLPDLVDVKGKDTTSDNSPNPTTTMAPDTRTPSLPPVNTAKTPTNTSVMRPVWEGRKDIDYRTMNNPHAQPSHCTTSQNEALNSSRPLSWESAHLTSETLLETLSRHDPNNLEWLPHTVEEALKSDEKAEWRKAINDELEQLQEKGTWWLEELLDGREV